MYLKAGRLVNFVSYTGIIKGVLIKCKKRLEHYKETVSYVVTQFTLEDIVGRKMKYQMTILKYQMTILQCETPEISRGWQVLLGIFRITWQT